jgi:gluconokinase
MTQDDAGVPTPLPLVVMGVSGSGKSTVAAQLAGRIGLPFIDGDDLHPQSNVEKMHSGTPLNDDDRWPWLDRVAATLTEKAERGGVVLACSALKRIYRDRLRRGTNGLVRFAFLDVDFDEIDRRLKQRVHHFMPKQLLQSQFDTLERPAPDETDIVTIAADGAAEDIVAELARRFGR